MKVSIVDKMHVAGTVRTSDGYLAADARIARTGIYEYSGAEMGMPDRAVVKVYRPEETVFSDASMASFAHKPVTLGHPAQNVTSDNWAKHARGYSGDTVKRDGQFVRVPLIVTDAAAIRRVEAGEVELSAGYTVQIDHTPGTTPDGEAYDCAMVGAIVGNHIAIVPKGRAGSQCRIGDSLWPTDVKDSPDVTTKTAVIDGVPVLVTDASEAIIAKRDATIMDLTAARDKAVTDLAVQQAEVVRLNKELSDAKVTPERLAALVTARAAVVADAAKLAPDLTVTDAMDDAAIRKAVVSARLGDVAKDWNDAQISAVFASFPRDEAPAGNRIGDALQRSVATKPVADENKAWNDSVADLNAWRNKA